MNKGLKTVLTVVGVIAGLGVVTVLLTCPLIPATGKVVKSMHNRPNIQAERLEEEISAVVNGDDAPVSNSNPLEGATADVYEKITVQYYAYGKEYTVDYEWSKTVEYNPSGDYLHFDGDQVELLYNSVFPGNVKILD